MRIGYCSPFNPMRTGISDFSEELIAELKKYIDIVVFCPISPSNTYALEGTEVHLLEELDNAYLRNSMDLIVYHMANNYDYHNEIYNMLLKYGGVVEIHEIGFHHFIASRTLWKKDNEAYLELSKYCHGTRGESIVNKFFDGQYGGPWDWNSLDMNMARPIVEAASAAVVHSDFVKQQVLGINENLPTECILHHSDCLELLKPEQRKAAKQKHGWSHYKYIIGTFGFATAAKRVIPALDAMERLKKERDDFMLCIVGEAQKELCLENEIQKRNLENNVIITGFVNIDLFKDYMDTCDLCLNLRYPTQGESSGTLHRMLGKGIPSVVTDIGTFSSYPDDIVIKVSHEEKEVEDIYHAVKYLIENDSVRKRMSVAANSFAKKYCDIKENAIKYKRFFESLINNTWELDYEDRLITLLCELGLTSESYIKHFTNALHLS